MSWKTEWLKFVDRTVGALLCWALSRAQRTPETRTLADLPPNGRLLAIRPGGLGDAILLVPALRALRAAAPGRALDVVCESRNADVFRLAGVADRIFEFDTQPLRTLAALRRGPWALALDSEQFHHFSAVFAVLSRAPLRVGFGINPTRFGLYTHLVPYDTQGPEREQFMRLVMRIVACTERDSHAEAAEARLASRVSCPKSHAEAAESAEMNSHAESAEDAEGDSGFVLCHAGGSVEAKRWPAEAFAVFCVKLHEKTGLPCHLVGGREDRFYAAEIVHEISALTSNRETGDGRRDREIATSDWIRNLVGKLSLEQTASACRKASVLVGPDSGVAHLAVAVGTPAVVLFGPSDPDKWGPPAGRGAVVRVSVPCAPCSMFGSVKPCRRRVCMERILPEQVLAAVETFLSGTSKKQPEP